MEELMIDSDTEDLEAEETVVVPIEADKNGQKKTTQKKWLISFNLKNKFSHDFSYFHFENFPYQGSVNFF